MLASHVCLGDLVGYRGVLVMEMANRVGGGCGATQIAIVLREVEMDTNLIITMWADQVVRLVPP